MQHSATHKLTGRAVIDFASIQNTNHLLCISKTTVNQDYSFSAEELHADTIFVYNCGKRIVLQSFSLEAKIHSLDLSGTGKIALLYSCAVSGSYVDDAITNREIQTWTVYNGKPWDFVTRIYESSTDIDSTYFDLKRTTYLPEYKETTYLLSRCAFMNPCFYGEDHVILLPTS
ncbi:hypothetical protein DFH11DRAFT_587873 [Phellopilus nigrolimitatus]|nr:hypothetical protein DFH11DRAFT_587873 [Phellopilus nigrolimitatus]